MADTDGLGEIFSPLASESGIGSFGSSARPLANRLGPTQERAKVGRATIELGDSGQVAARKPASERRGRAPIGLTRVHSIGTLMKNQLIGAMLAGRPGGQAREFGRRTSCLAD